ncbi:MAG: ribonuclease HI [Candidatus Zhuqueibacterota bacterium]
MAKKNYYVVFIGRSPGIYKEWFGEKGAEAQITGFSGARYKGFATLGEAKQALNQFKKTNVMTPAKKPPVQYEPLIPQPEPGRRHILMYTDGGCIGNPGPGGYGVVIMNGEKKREISGGFRHTTNNRMELSACILGLQALKTASNVMLHSDSRYVVYGMTKGWAQRWRSRNWMRTKIEPAENADLWAQLLQLCERHRVQFVWVKGHAGHPENERCDELATRAARQPDLPADVAFESGQTILNNC